MSDNNFPVINAHFVSWAEAKFGISIPDGEDLDAYDIASLKFTPTLEGSDVPGAGPVLRGRTIGRSKFEGELAMYFDAAQRLKKALAAQSSNGKRYGVVPFNLTVSFSPVQGEGLISTVQLVGCRIKSAATDLAASSTDAIVVTMPLSILAIEEDEDGLTIY